MESLVTLIKSLIEESKSRLRNPFLGTFTITLFLFNWKQLTVYLFSDYPALIRVYIIDILNNRSQFEFYQTVLLSILIAFSIRIIVPHIQQAVDYLTKKSIMARYGYTAEKLGEKYKGEASNATKKREIAINSSISAETAFNNEMLKETTKKLEDATSIIDEKNQFIQKLENNNLEFDIEKVMKDYLNGKLEDVLIQLKQDPEDLPTFLQVAMDIMMFSKEGVREYLTYKIKYFSTLGLIAPKSKIRFTGLQTISTDLPKHFILTDLGRSVFQRNVNSKELGK